jgi:hypothetical protein
VVASYELLVADVVLVLASSEISSVVFYSILVCRADKLVRQAIGAVWLMQKRVEDGAPSLLEYTVTSLSK